ncbi:hypothetical protein HDF15_004537 [Granulicella mallensis]|uniref:Uncharacterized protein n=1 Tax=Granulicella mallensis TaxID=940614 RepID=A0A7W7ZUV3_9BACT|nr:hypothetical protein [Granulicella mallensis]
MKKDTSLPKREKHIPERIKLADSSAYPGVELIEALTERRPTAEAKAILEAWKFCFQPYSFKKHSPNRFIHHE